MKLYDVIIIGGGLAGLTAAIDLKKRDCSVLVIEKNTYPNHKVCGEYVSNEVKPYLEYLGVNLNSADIIAIDTLQMSTTSGKRIETELPLGGFGISRYVFDNLLYKNALALGVEFVFDSAVNTSFNEDIFEITLASKEIYTSKIAIGAFGKRSSLDKKLNREFIQQKSPWLGVKCHYEFPDFPTNVVALHNFSGGYGGLSKTEDGSVNFCYLTSFKSFKEFNSIEAFNKKVVAKNPFLGDFLSSATPKFKNPLSIAQISFERKKAVENHLLMCGDSAGLIHPLCGNGMAMAIHSAKIASDCITDYLRSPHPDRKKLEQFYAFRWRKEFAGRLRMGRAIQKMLMNETASNLAIATIAQSEKILQSMIKRTHGNPILV
ncbi:NAD(P)/FAD-dependent oxidoreductase [uncultured Croceitalea sp.]|uniref:NAD(P)/FAD-dependent oxidoreductase n=1 Tax=uncultured Croceitalea sp. TaxID=1798908 RepID=UPI00330596C7